MEFTLDTPDLSLELSGDGLQSLVDRAMSRIAEHVDSLAEQPSGYEGGGAELARTLVESLPEDPSEFDDVLSLLFERAVPKSFNTAGPGYLAYIPGGGVLHSAVADLIADSVNRYVGVWIAAPGLSQLEANVIRWFCDIVGFGADAQGFLTSGGSLANFSAVVAARKHLLPQNFLTGMIYTSDQVHDSVQKAANLAGFPIENVRIVESDEHFCVKVDALERRVIDDRTEGLNPFMIVGSAGTTNTGAVDDLAALADVAARHGMWFHVDAAYGGFFAMTERGRRAFAGIELAHSVTLDPHKGLFLPYGCGSLLVRDGTTLREAHMLEGDYLPEMQREHDLVDFCQISPELSRPFRGLRVWLPIKLCGLGPFRRNLDEKLDLARWACDRLREMPEVDVVAEPQLSVVAFRLRPNGIAIDDANARNREFMKRINARGRVYLTGTLLDGQFTLRICVLSFRTHLDRIRVCIEDIRAAATEVLGVQPAAD